MKPMPGVAITDTRLSELRNEAVEAWREAWGLMVLGQYSQGVTIALKFAVSAQARYTLACAQRQEQDRGDDAP